MHGEPTWDCSIYIMIMNSGVGIAVMLMRMGLDDMVSGLIEVFEIDCWEE